ncbi:unnamed protein product [Discosporangium mesarthrocarpum]
MWWWGRRTKSHPGCLAIHYYKKFFWSQKLPLGHFYLGEVFRGIVRDAGTQGQRTSFIRHPLTIEMLKRGTHALWGLGAKLWVIWLGLWLALYFSVRGLRAVRCGRWYQEQSVASFATAYRDGEGSRKVGSLGKETVDRVEVRFVGSNTDQEGVTVGRRLDQDDVKLGGMEALEEIMGRHKDLSEDLPLKLYRNRRMESSRYGRGGRPQWA